MPASAIQMPRPERPIDVSDPWAPMAQKLRELRAVVSLTYTELGQRASYSGAALSMTTATGTAMIPDWEKVRAFITACGVSDSDEIARWRRDYESATGAAHRIVAAGPDSTGPTIETVRTSTQFASGMRSLLEQAGLSYQRLVDDSSGKLAKSTISGLLNGRIQPTEATVRTFLTVCQQHVPVDVDAWLAALSRTRGGPTIDLNDLRQDVQSQQPYPDLLVSRDGRIAMPDWADRQHGSPGSVAVADRDPSAALNIRDLASRGLLAEQVRRASLAQQRQLRKQAYEIAAPVVFAVVTRPVERKRGHSLCARGVRDLQPDCLDRYHDDVEAAVDTLLRTDTQIVAVEAWLARCAPSAAVDGYRRRRGVAGALQRPRLTRVLNAALDGDPWLRHLALQILWWVGTPGTAGVQLWPLDAWITQRSDMTGDHRAGPAVVLREIDQVLEVLRRRPAWYEYHVEQPLSRKQPPTAPLDEIQGINSLRSHKDAEDDRLRHLAALAMDTIRQRLADGGDPQTVVIETFSHLFGAGTGADEMDRIPGETSPDDEILERVADPAVIERVLKTIAGMQVRLSPSG